MKFTVLIRAFVFFVMVLNIIGCQSDTKNIRSYYFPLKELQEGLVYEYRSVNNDTLLPNYWYYRSFPTDSAVYLTSTYYDPATLAPTQLMREEMVSNGMLVNDLYLFEMDSVGQYKQIQAEIIAGSIFPFEVRDSGGIFLYKTTWQSPTQQATYTLTKNRRYAGDTTFTYQNQTFDAVIFDVKELIEQEQEGTFEKQYSSVEWYARGLGLVYYRKTITPTLVLEYRLAERYPMEQLEAIFKEKQQQ